MDRIAAFVNDAQTASTILDPLLRGSQDRTSWTVVLCAPQLTRHIGRFLSNRQRRLWRNRWATEQRGRLEPLFLGSQAADVEWHVPTAALSQTVAMLRQRHGKALRLLDLRRRDPGLHVPDLETHSLRANPHEWKARLAAGAGVSIVLAIAD